ncbi:MAG: PPC domain-containing DNA-binding protein [Patescibacteria group bacterium]
MKITKQKNSEYVLVFKRGENYPSELIKFLKKKKIRSGFFFGLGALENPEISYYDLKKKRYLSRRFKGIFEVLSLVGNVAVLGKELVIHEHIVLGDRNYRVFGGHLKNAKIGGTLEVFFQKTKFLERFRNFKTGLNLLD